MTQQNSILPLHIILFYSFPALALAMLGIIYFVYLPKFYAESVGASLAGLGAVILLTRVFDAGLDPFVGSLSDLKKKGKRRLPFIRWAIVPLLCSFLALVFPALSGVPISATVWFLGFSTLFFIAWTFFAVPYEALGTELSFDYDQRTRLFAWRDGLLVTGTLLAVVSVETLKTLLTSQAQALVWSSVLIGVVLIAATILLLVYVKENITSTNESDAPTDKSKGYFALLRSAWDNKAFRVLLIAFVLNGFGAALPATLILFFVQYVLGQDVGSYYLLLYLVSGILSFPLWVYVAKRYEKKACWLLACVINSGAFAFTMFVGRGDFLIFAVICVVSGIGFSGVTVIPSSMQADVIDYQEQRTGHRQEGGLVGIWSIARKLSAAVGAGIALPILDWVGFIPNQEQSYKVLAALSGLYAGIPVVCTLLAMYFISLYPISKSEHVAASNASANKWTSTPEGE